MPFASAPSRAFVRRWLDRFSGLLARAWFPGSTNYWRWRYAILGSSGAGSYGEEARLKADFINNFVLEHGIMSVIEFGCGDGAQLQLLKVPSYVGVDVSRTAIKRCRDRFAQDPTRRFLILQDYCAGRAELALSLDVIYHLVEDDVYDQYMHRLFAAADRYVLIYSTNRDDAGAGGASHVRHRKVSRWIDVHCAAWQSCAVHSDETDHLLKQPTFLAFELRNSTVSDETKPPLVGP